MTDTTQTRIATLVKDHPVVLFMKGNQDFPMCGFSARAVQVLKRLGVTFHDVDVLEDDDIREGVKVFSEWPTIPQLYVQGEFLGGCDIMVEMFQSGELQQLLAEKKLIAAA
ncbi:MAG: Grx4 family monothiol glutaredoxin [Alphaproteobacteria bacterium]